MIRSKLYLVMLLMAVATAFCFANVAAAEDWKSKYRDVEQIEGTDYFIIHLYDVQTGGGLGYASGVADADGNVVLPVEYGWVDTEYISDGRRLIATLGDKWGFVDESFKLVIEPVYDMADRFENGAARVQKSKPDGTNRVFHIDANENEIPDPTPEAERDFEYYSTLTSQELGLYIHRNSLGGSDYAICQKPEGNFGIINVKTKEYLTELIWNNIVADDSGTAWAQIMGENGLFRTSTIALDGTEEYKFDTEHITSIAYDGNIFIMKLVSVKQQPYDNQGTEPVDALIPLFGLIDKEGNVNIEPTWEAPVAWRDDMPGYEDGFLIGQQNSENYFYVKGIGTVGDGKYGCVNKYGNIMIDPAYDNITYEGGYKFTLTTGDETKTLDLSSYFEPDALIVADAVPTSSPIYINGTKVDFEAYLIDGYNYFKLRDIACALNGTAKQFGVGFDGTKNTITLTTGEVYTATGEELKKGDGMAKEASPLLSELYLDGEKAELIAYNISGYNYFRLRDLGELLNFAVDFDASEKAVIIDTDKEYRE